MHMESLLDRPSSLEALDAAFDRHFADLVRLSRALGAGGEAEDIAQEVMVYARAHVWQLRDPDSLGSWLRAIAARKTIRLTASRKNPPDSHVYAPGDPDLRLDLADALRRLPPRERAAVTLVYMLGYTEEATAQALGVRRGTIAASLFHARNKMATWLIEYERSDIRGKAK